MRQGLKIIKHIPKGFLDVKASEITQFMDRSALIHLPGKKDKPLFVSILLHGSEFSGLTIMQNILKKYRTLPKSLVLFIGNPQAAAQGVRHLKNQRDFNRIWKGGSFKESLLAQSVLKYARDQKIQAGIDIHNNSGQNPVYSCINKKKESFVKLAQAFSKNVVYFTHPDSVLSIALSKICPSVVIECGLPGDPKGLKAGTQFIEKLLHKGEQWKKDKIKISHLYQTQARLCIDPSSRLSFRSPPLVKKDHLCLNSRFDEFNFKKIKPGTVLGKISSSQKIKLINKKGENVFDQFFSIKENNLTVKTPFTPSMFTKNIEIARSDCLGYIMKKRRVEDFIPKK